MSFLEDDLRQQKSPTEPVHPWVLEEFEISSHADDSIAEEFDLLAPVADDELTLRRRLRTDIVRLERDLSNTVSASFPLGARVNRAQFPGSYGRVLSATELELVRDDLADQLQLARDELSVRAEAQEEARQTLERMMLAPGEYRHTRIALQEIGEYGCGVYHVKPRLGLIGRFAGWWQIKLSSGCPLAGGRGAPRPAI